MLPGTPVPGYPFVSLPGSDKPGYHDSNYHNNNNPFQDGPCYFPENTEDNENYRDNEKKDQQVNHNSKRSCHIIDGSPYKHSTVKTVRLVKHREEENVQFQEFKDIGKIPDAIVMSPGV